MVDIVKYKFDKSTKIVRNSASARIKLIILRTRNNIAATISEIYKQIDLKKAQNEQISR